MKKFKEFLKEQILNEAPPGAGGGLGGSGISVPPGFSPGGPPPGGGPPSLPPLGGGPPPLPSLGGGGPPPGPPGAGGPAGQKQSVMKLKSPDVWSVLGELLSSD